MNGAWNFYTNWKKLEPRDQMQQDPIYMTYPEQENL